MSDQVEARKRGTVPLPVKFQIRPANRGLNYLLPPQAVDMRESPANGNVRFSRSQIALRVGFKHKYTGLAESALWLDAVYAVSGSTLIALTELKVYEESGGVFTEATIYDGDGDNPATEVGDFTMDPSQQWWAVDVGQGRGYFNDATEPLAGSAYYPVVDGDQADFTAICNGTTDGVILIMDFSGVVGEVLSGNLAPTSAKAVCFFDNRLVCAAIGDNFSEVQWSIKGDFTEFDSTLYDDTGSEILGDGADRIQALKRMGEYLLIYKERSIFVGRKSGVSDPAILFDPAPGEGIGLAAPNSIGDLGEEHIFLGWDDVYVFSFRGVSSVGSRIKSELFGGTDGILPEFVNSVQGIVAEEFDEYWLLCPTGKIPDATNLLLNPNLAIGVGGTPTSWSVATDNDGTCTKETGGNFGNVFRRLNKVTGAYEHLYSNVTDYGEGITDWRFCAVVWLKTNGTTVTAQFGFRTLDGAGANANVTLYRTIVVDHTDWRPYYFSGVIVDADAEQIGVFVAATVTTDNLDVDCVHLIGIEDTTDASEIDPTIDNEYLYTDENGYEAIAYIDALGGAQPFPFIMTEVKPWMLDTAWVYDYKDDAWSKWRLPLVGFGYDTLVDVVRIEDLTGTILEQTWRFDEKLLEAFAPTNLIAHPDGNVYEMSVAYAHDWEDLLNRDIVGFWDSKDFDLGFPDQDKTLSRVVLLHEATHAAVTITVGASTDSGETIWEEQDVIIRAGRTQTFADFFITGPQVRFRVRASSPGFYLSGFAVKIIPRGESHAF